MSNNLIITLLKNLKIMQDQGILYRQSLGGEYEQVACDFFAPLSNTKLAVIMHQNPDIILPAAYSALLSYSDGVGLYRSMTGVDTKSYVFQFYSLAQCLQNRTEILQKNNFLSDYQRTNYLPIGLLRDIGEIYIDMARVKNGNPSYLTYPFPENKYFKFPLDQWLDRFIVAQGNEFWLLNN